VIDPKEQERKLTAEILERVREIARLRLETEKEFVPGKTPVKYAGRVYGEEEMVNLAQSAIEFWLTGGRWHRRLEEGLAEWYGVTHARLVNSGSSANLVAIAALTSHLLGDRRLEPGDEVITVAAGFPTTVAPVLQLGMVPVFVDVSLPTYNLDVSRLEGARSPRTRAVMVAHTLGNPFDLDAVGAFCKRHGLWLVEDNCDAAGSRYRGKKTGTFGDLATLSFYPPHHMTSLDAAERVLVVDAAGRAFWREIGPFCDTEDVERWRCVSFDAEGRLKVVPITGSVKHPCAEPLIRLRLEGGRTAVVTASHSIFTPSANGPVATPTSALRIGDLVYAPRILPRAGETLKSVQFTRHARGSWKPEAAALPVTPTLGRLLGWYAAEGSLFGPTKQGNYNFTFTLGPKEEAVAERLRDDVATVFDVKSRIHPRPSGWALKGSSREVFEFLHETCGTGAGRKRVPPFLFSAPPDVRNEFLGAYFAGDGNHRNQHGEHDQWEAKTISRELAYGVHALLLQEELSPRFREDPSVVRHSPNQKPSVCQPTTAVSYGTSGNGRANAKSFRGLTRRASRRFGDLVLLEVTGIEEVQPTTAYVYDLSVRGYENFVAGAGMVVHNTGEGGAVLCSDDTLQRAVESFRDWGRDCWCAPGVDNTCKRRFEWQLGDLPKGYDHKYVYSHLGFNLKMTDMQAAVGVAQLARLDGFVEARRRNWEWFRKELRDLEDVLVLPEPTPHSEPSWFGFMATVREGAPFGRDALVRHLEARKVQTRMLFAGNVVRQPVMTELARQAKEAGRPLPFRVAGSLEASDAIMNRSFWVGVYPGLTAEMRAHVAAELRAFARR
jgi:dTDP-4-amino-4,6-dideoxygalactose transaminase